MFSLFARLLPHSHSSRATGWGDGNPKRLNMNGGNSMESTLSGRTLQALGPRSLSCLAEMPETRRLVVTAALDKVLTQKYFDVCTIDTILKIMGTRKNCAAYDLLHALHCMHYDQMQPELRNSIPQLINECLRGPIQDAGAATGAALEGITF